MPGSYYLFDIKAKTKRVSMSHITKIEHHFTQHVSAKTTSEYLRTLKYLLLISLSGGPAQPLTPRQAAVLFEQMSAEEANALLRRLTATQDDPAARQELTRRWRGFGLAPSYVENRLVSATLGLLKGLTL